MDEHEGTVARSDDAAESSGGPVTAEPHQEPGLPTGTVPRAAARAGKAPRRPLLEAGLVLAAFWIGAWLPTSAASVGASMAEPAWHLAMILDRLPKTLLLLYLIHVEDGFAAFGGLGKPRRRDLFEALVVAAGAFVIVLAPSALVGLFAPGLRNPLLDAASLPAASPLVLVPAVFLSCLAVGYAEELFFRFFLPRRLAQAGLAPTSAMAVSVLVFASAHSLQGALGLAMAALLGSWFAIRRMRGSSLHELAWGHGFYNAVVMLLTFYATHGAA